MTASSSHGSFVELGRFHPELIGRKWVVMGTGRGAFVGGFKVVSHTIFLRSGICVPIKPRFVITICFTSLENFDQSNQFDVFVCPPL